VKTDHSLHVFEEQFLLRQGKGLHSPKLLHGVVLK
jgi:hypothetical protein